MKYYCISSITRLRSNNEIVGSGGFMVMVESEEDVKSMIKYEKECQDLSGTCYEDDFLYKECSAKEYIDYQEAAALRHIKSYYYDKLEIDSSLPMKEYNKIKYTDDNEAKALDYYFIIINAYNTLLKEKDLSKMSAKEFIDSIKKISFNL